MKNILRPSRFAGILLLLVSLVGFTACSSSTDENDSINNSDVSNGVFPSVAGTWTINETTSSIGSTRRYSIPVTQVGDQLTGSTTNQGVTLTLTGNVTRASLITVTISGQTSDTYTGNFANNNIGGTYISRSAGSADVTGNFTATVRP